MPGRTVRLTLRFENPDDLVGLVISSCLHLAAAAMLLSGVSCQTDRPLGLPPSLGVKLVGSALASTPKRQMAPAAQPIRESAPKPQPPPAPTPTAQKPAARPTRQPAATSPPPSQPELAPSGSESEPAVEAPSTAEPTSEGPTGALPGGVQGGDPAGLIPSWYSRQLDRTLAAAWRDRPILPEGSPPQRVGVRFAILADGRVEAIEIVEPSGYDLLDHSVRRLLRGIGKLPALPREVRRDRIEVIWWFELLPPT